MTTPTPERPDTRVQIAQYVAGTIIVVALIAAVVALSAWGKDTTALLTLVSAVVVPTLGALLYGKLSTVEKQTNGNTSRLLEMVDKKTPDNPVNSDRSALR